MVSPPCCSPQPPGSKPADASLGPGHYDAAAAAAALLGPGPAFTIGSRPRPAKAADAGPGPGEYSAPVDSIVVGEGPRWTFGTRPAEPSSAAAGGGGGRDLGPGAYGGADAGSSGPAFSFGTRPGEPRRAPEDALGPGAVLSVAVAPSQASCCFPVPCGSDKTTARADTLRVISPISAPVITRRGVESPFAVCRRIRHRAHGPLRPRLVPRPPAAASALRLSRRGPRPGPSGLRPNGLGPLAVRPGLHDGREAAGEAQGEARPRAW